VEDKVEKVFTQKRTLLLSPPRDYSPPFDLPLKDTQRILVDQGKHGSPFLRFAQAGSIWQDELYG
jgi:hypothetical protein